jgi:hypothetical protein
VKVQRAETRSQRLASRAWPDPQHISEVIGETDAYVEGGIKDVYPFILAAVHYLPDCSGLAITL